MIKMEQRAGKEQEPTCAGIDSSTSSSTANGASLRLVPRVLKRLLLFVGPADNINCHFVQWLFRSVASSQLHIPLAVPKNGAFLLKWPLSYHDRVDVYDHQRQLRFLDLIRYNLSSKVSPTEIVNQIQVFLAGYEKLLLDEVYASAINLNYSNIHTFIVDFSIYDDESTYTLEQTLPLKKKSVKCMLADHQNDDNAVHDDWCFVTRKLFLSNWQQWEKTITAITDSCGATLSHLVFTTDSYARSYDFNYKGKAPNSFIDYKELTLPKQFYRALNFDKMLSKMQNLRTLCIPIHASNNAFHANPELAMDLDVVWPIVRSMPLNQLLPSLQRIVVREGGYTFDRPNGNMSGGFTFSNMPLASTNIMMECIANYDMDIQRETHHFSKVFTFVTRYNDRFVITPLYIDNADNRLVPYVDGEPPSMWLHRDQHEDDEDDFDLRPTIYRNEISEFVHNKAMIWERQLKLSVWNDLVNCKTESGSLLAAAKKALIVVQIADLCKKLPREPTSPLEVSETLKLLFDMLNTRQILPSAVRLVIEEVHLRSNGRWGWGIMHQILPFFTVNEASQIAAGDEAVLHAVRLNMKMGKYFTTFGAKVRLWKSKAKKRKIRSKKMFTSQYKFPGIHLTVVGSVESEATEHRPADEWVAAVEQAIKTKIYLLLRDAVDSCKRRDMSYYLYQSLKRIEYEFAVDLVGADEKVLKQVTLLWQSRAAESERRIVGEVAAEIVHVIDVADHSEQLTMFWRLADLVRLKVVKIIKTGFTVSDWKR